jgi:hypothetical protein
MRYTFKALQSDIQDINKTLEERKSNKRLTVENRNGYTAVDICRLEQLDKKTCERNLECGTPRECLAASQLFLLEEK